MNTWYLLGRAAFNEGKAQDDNPYTMGTRQWQDWWIGYRSAENAWYAEIN